MSRARDLADSADLAFDGNTLKIDSTNNRVGIGTDSPTKTLQVNGTTKVLISPSDAGYQNGINISDNTTTTVALGLQTVGGGNLPFVYGNSGLGFGTNVAERMRIDSSGNVLVGTTDTDTQNNNAGSSADNGFVYNKGSGGYFNVARYNGTVAYINRTGSDGTISEFRKDGATVGSIGASNNYMFIGDGNGATGAGLHFVNSNIRPYDAKNRSLSDAEIDFGVPTSRFKDLYLSGGVYLGGTGSANYLDDYEEGTWTPTIQGNGGASGQSYTAQYGKYIKIGNFIYMTYDVEISTVGTLSGVYVVLGSLPFTMVTQNMGGTVLVGYYSSWQNMPSGSGGTITAYTDGNNAYLMTPTASNGTDYITIGDNQVISGSRLIGSFVGYVA